MRACRQLSLYLFTCRFFIVQRQDPLFRVLCMMRVKKERKEER